MAHRIYITDNIDVVELDTEDIDTQSIFSLLDIGDISTRKDNIKMIQFHGTKQNNQAFGTFFDLGRVSSFDIPNRLLFNFNPLRSVTAVIYEESELIFKGSLRLSKITIDGNGECIYETIVTGSFIDIKTALQDRLLSDLDFSYLKHRYNMTNIKNSWSGSTERHNVAANTYSSTTFSYGSGYVYPCIDYGYTYYSATTATTVNHFHACNFKPAIYVKEYMDAIFRQPILSGFTYEIRGSEDFKNQFNQLIIPNASEGNSELFSGATTTYFKPYLVLYQHFCVGVEDKALVPISSYTVSGSSNLDFAGTVLVTNPTYNDKLVVKSTFSASALIRYNMDWTHHMSGMFAYLYPEKPVITVKLVKRTFATNNNTENWASVGEQSTTIEQNSNGVITGFVRVALTEFKNTEELAVMVSVNQKYNLTGVVNYKVNSLFLDIPATNLDTFGTLPNQNLNQFIKVEVRPSLTGGTSITPKAPENIKQMDFLKGIINQFNFVTYTRNDNHKHLIFEKYDDFFILTETPYVKDHALDWTNKIDYSKGVVNKSNIDLPKSYIFTHKNDNDIMTDKYFKKYNRIYGQLSFDDQYGLEEQKKVELLFSPLIPVSESNTDRMYPLLYQDNSGAKKISKTNIRMGYYTGLKPCVDYSICSEELSGSSWVAKTYYTGNTYPMVSNYHITGTPHFVTGTTVIHDLHFAAPLEYYIGVPYEFANAETNYRNYVDQITDLTHQDVAYIECYAKLTPIDITNLDFRYPVYINTGIMNAAYFKVIRVEYSGMDSLSKVQLQKIVFY